MIVQFRENCTLDMPMGAFMVSTEGTCSISYR
ncbi:MAG: hypothetical protein J5U16_04045 [Candidatus Methanoperedens sp.]|nr:hypothetical protein [Candidatus Methanoperedens sp.]